MQKGNSIKPDLNLGQHFIQDLKYLEVIASSLDKKSVVIEVGPGMGKLTEVLAKKVKKVIAIEIDKKFNQYLSRVSKKYKNLEVIFEDALSTKFDSIIKENKKGNTQIFVVSNLPYHITEPFLKKIAALKVPAILMVGKKFGYQSQITNPKDEHFSELSYVCRSFFEIQNIADVPKNAFWPIPRTDSVIIRLIPKSEMTSSDFVGQKVILGQKNGGLIKNSLMNAFIDLNATQNIKITKNQSRAIVNSLNLSENLLNKSFSQLDNDEVKTLASSIDKASLIV